MFGLPLLLDRDSSKAKHTPHYCFRILYSLCKKFARALNPGVHLDKYLLNAFFLLK